MTNLELIYTAALLGIQDLLGFFAENRIFQFYHGHPIPLRTLELNHSLDP